MRLDTFEGGFVQIEAADVEPSDDAHLGGDVSLIVSVSARGFSGATDVWVQHEAWQQFLGDLNALEEDRHGVATLVSMSPGELELTFQSVDRAGHMAVHGTLGSTTPTGNVHLAFSAMQFDPTLLPRLIGSLRRFSGAAA